MAAIDDLAKIISEGLPADVTTDNLSARVEKALDSLFGERYAQKSPYDKRVAIMRGEDNVPFAGLVHETSPKSGVYGGMSLIWFPVSGTEEHPPCSLLTFVCGTRGLTPDEPIMGRPGHARHLQALRRYLSKTYGVGVWAKHDPTNLTQPFPETIRRKYPQFSQVFSRYGNHIYCCVEVPNKDKARAIVAAFFDFYAWERGWSVLKSAQPEYEHLQKQLRRCVFSQIDAEKVYTLLRERRFVILQGPPGTGKSRLASEILNKHFSGSGMSVQFHPAVTYETFVAGISPGVDSSRSLYFDVTAGWLVQAVREANTKDYLLHIDEINRADLARVLGEAIYLLEPREIAAGQARKVALPQAIDEERDLSIPQGLYILGTMNSADRSIAILDMAVRRRFAFVDIWPDIGVIQRYGLDLAEDAFSKLQDIFSQYAPDDSLVLLPGHSYFLAGSMEELRNRLNYELIPLLNEYIVEGRLGSCENEIRAYIDWLECELDRDAA